MGGTVCREPFNNNSPKLVLVNNLTATRVMQTSIPCILFLTAYIHRY